MGKPKESKRRKFSHLNDAEAKYRRMIVNQQERERQLKISEALKELYAVLPKTENNAGQTSKLAILRQAKEYILQLQSGVNNGDNQDSAILCPNNNQQENRGVEQTSQYLGSQVKTELPQQSSNFMDVSSLVASGSDQTQWNQDVVLPQTSVEQTSQYLGSHVNTELPQQNYNFLDISSLVASGSDQTQWTQDAIIPQTSFYQGVDQSFMHNGSTSLDWSNLHQNGHSSNMDLSGSLQFLPALNSSIDNITDPQGFQTHIQPVVFCDQSPIPTVANSFTSKNQAYAYQGVNGRVGSLSTLTFVAQTPQNVPGKGFKYTSV